MTKLRRFKERFNGEQCAAKAALMPSLNAAMTVKHCGEPYLSVNLLALNDELRAASENVRAGDTADVESTLIAEAQTLDTLFHTLTRRALATASPDLQERLLRLAFKAQSQSRATLEALVSVKAPQSVAFVRQANIGQAVQVNNGVQVSPAPSPPRPPESENSQFRANELLEREDEKRLDAGAQGKATEGDPSLEAVEVLNRPEN